MARKGGRQGHATMSDVQPRAGVREGGGEQCMVNLSHFDGNVDPTNGVETVHKKQLVAEELLQELTTNRHALSNGGDS